MIIGFTSAKEQESTLLSTNSYKYEVAKKVYDQLIDAKGDKRLKVPTFVMQSKERYVAWMNGKKAQIGLEEKAYDVCVSYGADSLNAMAALLGHEIIHYYEKHNWGSEFASAYTNMELSKDVKSNTSSHTAKSVHETEADYLGGFLAHSAGFNTFGIMPKFLDAVYDAYGLTHEIPGYPSLENRAKLAVEAEGRMEELVNIYQTANHLVVLEQFEDAEVYFGYILKDFQSREIYNNAGVNAVMAALSLIPAKGFPESKYKKYAYPLQLDGQTRLEVNSRGGDLAFGNAQQKIVTELLNKAVNYFEQAKALDKKYETAYLNLACAYDIMGEHEDAQYWAKKAERLAKKGKNKKTRGDAKILRAIASFHLEEAEEGVELLTDVKNDFPLSANLAELNLYINTNNARPEVEAEKQKMSLKSERIEGFNLDDFAEDLDVDGQVEVNKSIVYAFKKLDQSKVSVHLVNSGERFVICQITNSNFGGTTGLGLSVGTSKDAFLKKYGPATYIQETRKGQYLVYKNKKAIFYIKDGKLASWTVYRTNS